MTETLNIGLVCHSTLGGSGVIATELGHALARRGHRVHFFCAEAPSRLDVSAPNIKLHTVKSPVHELFPGGEYALALASKLFEQIYAQDLDVVHVHYAIPHATSALLAGLMSGANAPARITTLHGTDVLTLGADPALRPIVRHSVYTSDAVTVPTRYLRGEMMRVFGDLGTLEEIEVIGNFVDTVRFCPPSARRPPSRPKTLLHNSNFRPLKRVEDTVRVLAEVRKRVPDAELVLVGDGPARPAVEQLVRELQLTNVVHFRGEVNDLTPVLQKSDAFIFPSQTESFGLAALEALACGVPVVATRTGGLPELIDDGETGFLRDVGDIAGLADAAVQVLTDHNIWARLSSAARAVAQTRWRVDPQVDLYEATYRRVLARGT